MKIYVAKKQKTRILVMAFAVIFALVFAGCGSTNPGDKGASATGQSTGTAKDGGEKELFTLRVVNQTQLNELVVADQLGFFKDEGIQIKYIGQLGQGVTQFQALAQGLIDVVTQGHPADVAKARLAGLKVKMVAPGYVDAEANPHIVYLTQDGSPLKSLDDLVGKKVGIPFSGVCTDGYIRYYFKEKGLDPDSVEFVTMTNPGAPEQALTQGLVDVTTSHSPIWYKTLNAGGVRKLATSWDIFQNPAAGFACRSLSDDFIAAHPDVVQGYVNAEYRARIFIINNLDYAKQVAGKFLNLDPKDLISNDYCPDKNVKLEYVDTWLKLAKDMNVLPADADIKAEDITENSFVPADVPASDADIGK